MAFCCREQLKRSHTLRLQGQKALDELKAEFEALTKDLAGGAETAAADVEADAAVSLSGMSMLSHGEQLLRTLGILDRSLTYVHKMHFHQHGIYINVSCRCSICAVHVGASIYDSTHTASQLRSTVASCTLWAMLVNAEP